LRLLGIFLRDVCSFKVFLPRFPLNGALLGGPFKVEELPGVFTELLFVSWGCRA